MRPIEHRHVDCLGPAEGSVDRHGPGRRNVESRRVVPVRKSRPPKRFRGRHRGSQRNRFIDHARQIDQSAGLRFRRKIARRHDHQRRIGHGAQIDLLRVRGGPAQDFEGRRSSASRSASWKDAVLPRTSEQDAVVPKPPEE